MSFNPEQAERTISSAPLVQLESIVIKPGAFAAAMQSFQSKPCGAEMSHLPQLSISLSDDLDLSPPGSEAGHHGHRSHRAPIEHTAREPHTSGDKIRPGGSNYGSSHGSFWTIRH